MDEFTETHFRNKKGKIIEEKTKAPKRVERFGMPVLVVKTWTDDNKFVTPDNVVYPIEQWPICMDEVLNIPDIPVDVIALNPEFFKWDIEANAPMKAKTAEKEIEEKPKKEEVKKPTSRFDSVLNDLKKEE